MMDLTLGIIIGTCSAGLIFLVAYLVLGGCDCNCHKKEAGK